MQPQFFNVINDELRGSEKTATVTNPRTEDELWPCPVASNEDFEDAVVAARKAFTTWGKSTVAERQAALVKMADVLEEHVDELADILSRETGKSAILASLDIRASIAQCLYYSKTALEDEVQYEDDNTRVVATHIPLGVVGAIAPWNFPVILANIKVVSSLITGNCVIVKPSPFTPYAVMKWAEISRGILPPGVFQVLNGGADLGALMTLHPGIDKISFTGTTATGKRVMASCAKTLKKVTLELAGNDACIVCPDADLDKTIPSVASGGFFNAGQVCVASKRIYVHESIYDEFLDRLVAEVEKSYSVQEDAAAPSVFGPVDNKAQFEVVKGIIEDCRKNGYKIVKGGKTTTASANGKGFWLEPTIVSRPPEDSWLVKEEQFGPILPILSWTDEDDVIKRSNLANAGLGASVYSTDLTQAERIARKLESGSVWINQSERPNFGAFFGGIKDSGYGGEMGKQGLLSYSYTQALHFAK
ncbi:aldehyde dehydrogenase domain-containing protein [Cercophora newfieldiana]|uniref:aldehyde dehydrogenase (NAD(+)) n=1 Tax=Cercophora newfieldiana TaxID=92897 RepID=A0AA39YF39_9PEZI|nr:aldehyde dehydrogenase domain-containing protein [Cercophora newfieldiana]